MAKAMQVSVQLVTSKETGEAVVIKVYSNRKNGVGKLVLQRTTRYSDMRSFKGGAPEAVHMVAAILADECHERFGDDEDPDKVGQAAVKAFKEALARAERQGFGKKRMEVGEDVYVNADVSEGKNES